MGDADIENGAQSSRAERIAKGAPLGVQKIQPGNFPQALTALLGEDVRVRPRRFDTVDLPGHPLARLYLRAMLVSLCIVGIPSPDWAIT